MKADNNGVFNPERLGEYTIIRDIAEGTFGIVKLARHTITGQMVAMKFISKALINRTKTKTRVQREVEYMKTLRHPHIIKLYDVISTPTDIIIVLEFAGGELFRYIVEHGRMPENRARRFFQQLISGIEYSHKLKIVHRDLKPENVLLDDGLNVKIADFGLSNEIKDGDFLKTSCGSPNYAAPEVIRGALYTGPEIDVWSCGVILYVMLTGSLPFEDDNVKLLFDKITQGVYHPPQDVSRDALSLIEAMLVVDPVKRITINEITQHPFFTKDLPRYLTPLPPPPGPVLPTLSALVAPPKALDFEIIDGLGRIEEDVVEELAGKLENTTLEDVWEALRREDGGNAVKVAYLLLRDKHRLGRDLAEFEEQERDAQLAALDPRNAVSPGALSPGGGELEANPFESEFNQQYTTGEDDALSSSTLSDTAEGDEEDYGPDYPYDPNINNISVLNSSLPGQLPDSHHLANYVKARAGRERERSEKKMHRTKWHFGIRSRSPSMEVMLEIYRTLQALGMEWKEKGNLGGLGQGALGMGRDGNLGGKGGEIRRAKEHDGYGDVDLKAAAAIYFIETRARVGDVVVLMNIQLYTVDSSNYLVDFHHKKTYKASTVPGAGKYDMAYPRPIEDYLDSSSSSTTSSSVPSVSIVGAAIKAHGDLPGVGAKEEDVVSPFVFMDVANRLILELAGGGQ